MVTKNVKISHTEQHSFALLHQKLTLTSGQPNECDFTNYICQAFHNGGIVRAQIHT